MNSINFDDTSDQMNHFDSLDSIWHSAQSEANLIAAKLTFFFSFNPLIQLTIPSLSRGDARSSLATSGWFSVMKNVNLISVSSFMHIINIYWLRLM